jgi:tetratricopeptide (TPR) repeat protein
MKAIAQRDKVEFEREQTSAEAIMQKLAAQHPEIPLLRANYLRYVYNHALILFSQGDLPRGHEVLQQWITQSEKLADDFPRVPEFRFQTCKSLARAADSLAGDGKKSEAAQYSKTCHALLKRLGTDFPQCARYRRVYADDYTSYAERVFLADPKGDIEPILREGLQEWQKLATDFPGIADYQRSLAVYHSTLGLFVAHKKKYQAAEEAYGAAIRILEGLVKDHPLQVQLQADLANGFLALGQVKLKQSRLPEAIAAYTQAIAVLESAFRAAPKQRHRLETIRAAVKLRADAHLKAVDHQAYHADLARMQELSDAQQPAFLRLYRILERARKDELAAALKEAEDLFQNVEMSDTQWRDLAAFYADMTARATDAKQKEDLAQRAVACLRNAIEQGLLRAGLAEDARFQPLAARNDFKQLVQNR